MRGGTATLRPRVDARPRAPTRMGAIVPHRPSRDWWGFFPSLEHTVTTIPLPQAPTPRASVVIDYQNVHMLARECFAPDRPLHEVLIDPLLFAEELVRRRNAAQGEGYPHIKLGKVLVYRGLPSSEYDPEANSYNLQQKHHWERDGRVQVVHRPLRYRIERDPYGTPILDINGQKTIIEKREKGIDVLCALAVVREAASPTTQVVIIASHDSDLEPAIEEARRLGSAKVEVCRWHSEQWVYQLRAQSGAPVWCTRLDQSSFQVCLDTTPYEPL